MGTATLPESIALQLLSKVSMTLVANMPYPRQMQETLATIGHGIGVSRTYIFLDSEDGCSTTNVFEWCANGITPQIDSLQNIPYEIIPSWKPMLMTEGRIHSQHIATLPSDLFAALEPQGILSLLVYPLMHEHRMIGFVGFDECQRIRDWTPVDLDLLRTVSGMLTAAILRHWSQQKANAALKKFSALFASNPALMAIRSLPDLTFLDVNDSFVEKTGYARNEIIGQSSEALDIYLYPEQKEMVRHELTRRHRVMNMELALRRKDGRVLYGLMSGEVIEIDDQSFYLTVLNDNTAQHELNRLLSKERQRLEHIINSTRLGTWEWHVPSGRLLLNEHWCRMCGYTMDELQPISIATWKNLCHPDDLHKADRLLEEHFRGHCDYYECECRLLHKDDHWVWVLDRGKVIEWNSDGTPSQMFGTHTDISEIKLLEERLRAASLRDPLTDTYNRRYFIEQLQTAISEFERSKIPFALAMLDIDHFKEINDTYGHPAGDQVLVDLTRLISMQIRPYDILGRFGGEEFVLLLKGIDERRAVQKLESLLASIRSAIIHHEGQHIKFSFSAGVIGLDRVHGGFYNTQGLLELVDKRLYDAKESGRNCVRPQSDASKRAQ